MCLSEEVPSEEELLPFSNEGHLQIDVRQRLFNISGKESLFHLKFTGYYTDGLPHLWTKFQAETPLFNFSPLLKRRRKTQ